MPRSLLGGGALVALALLAAVPAAAEPATVERAQAAIDQSDYITARTMLGDVLANGQNGPAQLAEIYRLTGVVVGALGDAKAAQEAFTRCLALDPKVTLPAGTSPKIAKPFAAAVAYGKTHEALKIKTETATDPPAVTVIVASDPLGMIAKFRVIASVDGKPETTLDRPSSERSTIELPKGHRIDLRVAALDDRGNRLAELGSTDVPIVIVSSSIKAPVVAKQDAVVGPPPPPPKPGPVKPRPLYLRWWLWGGVSAIVLGGGAYFGIDALRAKHELDDLNATSSNHSFDEALAVEHHARRSLLLANVGLIGGGVLAAGATVLYLIRPRERAGTERRLAVTPVAHPQGAGIVLGGHF